MIFRQIFIFVVDGVVFVINVGVNDVNADCVDVYDDVDVFVVVDDDVAGAGGSKSCLHSPILGSDPIPREEEG